MVLKRRKLSSDLLPFESIGWEEFEQFCTEFLGAGFVLSTAKTDHFPGGEHRIASADLLRSGEAQQGVDIVTRTEGGLTFAFQCKYREHSRNWGPEQTRNAIEKAESEFPRADRYFLLLSCEGSRGTRQLVRKHPNWELWDSGALSRRFLLDTPQDKAVDILARFFGTDTVKRLFPLSDSVLIEAGEFFSPLLREERLFHQGAALAGRRTEVERFHEFVRAAGKRVLLVAAPGGIGKTRLLKAFADEFSECHPERQLRIVNPEASGEPNFLRGADVGKLVILHDDAHRMESYPIEVIREVVRDTSGESKLFFATRPQGREALIERLMEAGFGSDEIVPFDLEPLTRSEMESLAAGLLGSENGHVAKPLADLSGGCALVVVVGAEMIRRGLASDLILNSHDRFRTEVFQRFEGEELKRIGEEIEVEFLKRVLRTIAVLSPWKRTSAGFERAEKDPVEKLAGFLGADREKVETACERLMIGGLLRETGDGLRVVPDLFSDHLVFAACYRDSGQPTPFIMRLLNTYGMECSGPVLRNLGEAEWRAHQQFDKPGSILERIWRQVLSQFEGSNFWERSRILEDWSAFSVFQPRRAIELVEWALDLDTAEFNEAGSGRRSLLDDHRWVVEKVPGLLKPVALYHDEYRSKALDILWRMVRNPEWELKGQVNPLEVIAKVAGFKQNFPASTEGVLEWIEATLGTAEGIESLLMRPSSHLATILSPVFTHFVEKNWTTGMTLHFGAVPVFPKKTRYLWKRVFSLLREQVLPHGEVAALNAIAVLEQAVRRVMSPYYAEPPAPNLMRSWLASRRLALDLVREILERYPTSLIRFKTISILRHSADFDESPAFARDCRSVIESIPDTAGLRLARLLLSNGQDEFPRSEIDRIEAEGGNWVDVMNRKWNEFGDLVAREFIGSDDSPTDGLAKLGELVEHYGERGYYPNLGRLLQGIARERPNLAESLVDLVLSRPESSVDPWLNSLFGSHIRFPDDALERWIIAVFRGENVERQNSVLNLIHWGRRGEMPPAVVDALLHLVESGSDETIRTMIYIVKWSDWGGGDLWRRMVGALLDGIDDESALTELFDALSVREHEVLEKLSDSLIRKAIDRLESLHSISDDRVQHFIRILSNDYARELFDLLVRRLEKEPEELEAGREFAALPWSSRRTSMDLKGLAEEDDFKEIARGILDDLKKKSGQGSIGWARLFQAAVLRTDDFGIQMLREWVDELESEDELSLVTDLLDFEGSLIIFRYPDLTEAILAKARHKGPEFFDSVRIDLINGAGPKGRGYTNGKLDEKYQYLLKEAEKAALSQPQGSVLREFYDTIVQWERADNARHLEEYRRRLEPSDW